MIAELKESLEQAKFQLLTILDKINDDGEKHQMDVKTLLDLNNTMQTKTFELENRKAEGISDT